MTILCITRPPVKPTQHAVRPARPFGEGILSSPARFVPSDANLAWAAQNLNDDATDYDVLTPELAPIRGGAPELDWDAMAWEDAAQARLERGHCL
jgi:hypothetical protein